LPFAEILGDTRDLSQAGGRGGWGNIAEEKPLTEEERKDVLARQEADQTIIEEHRAQEVDQP
jgi:hypothetical protein